MFKSAADWQKVWPSFEVHSLDHIERALAALSKQLGIETQYQEKVSPSYEAQETGNGPDADEKPVRTKVSNSDKETGEAILYSQHVAQFLDRLLEEAKKNDER